MRSWPGRNCRRERRVCTRSILRYPRDSVLATCRFRQLLGDANSIRDCRLSAIASRFPLNRSAGDSSSLASLYAVAQTPRIAGSIRTCPRSACLAIAVLASRRGHNHAVYCRLDLSDSIFRSGDLLGGRVGRFSRGGRSDSPSSDCGRGFFGRPFCAREPNRITCHRSLARLPSLYVRFTIGKNLVPRGTLNHDAVCRRIGADPALPGA